MMKIWGREPTLWIALIAAVLNWAVGFQLDFLSAEQAAWINAAINAVMACIASFATRPIAPQVWFYAVTVFAGLLAAYGLDMSQEMVGTTQLLVIAVLSLITRGSVSPKEDAHETGVLGDKITT